MAAVPPPSDPSRTIAFQGAPGAYSHLACRQVLPELAPLPCDTFEDAFAAVIEGRAIRAMIPIENSVAGRVADIHHLLPDSPLYIVGEHFMRVQHCLLAAPGTTLAGVKNVYSHIHALSQCRDFIRRHGLKAHVFADTAGAAAEIARRRDPADAAIASSLAAEIYGLTILKTDLEDAEHNTTRFVILARESVRPALAAGPAITSFIFRVRNVPAALYKAMGGFATNGVNMVKLESYQVGGSFAATQFYADIEGHADDPPVIGAFEELGFFTRHFKVLGVYPAHSFRRGG